MRRALLVLSVASCLLASGCWLAPGQNAGRTGFNPDETTLTASTIGGVHQLWTTPLRGRTSLPITDDQSVFVAVQVPGDAHPFKVDALTASTGATRWESFGFGNDLAPVSGLLSSNGTLMVSDRNSETLGVSYLDANGAAAFPFPSQDQLTFIGGAAPEITAGRQVAAVLGQEDTGQPMEVDATQLPFSDGNTPQDRIFRVILPDSPLGTGTIFSPSPPLLPLTSSGNTFYASGGSHVWAVDIPPACPFLDCVTWTSPTLPGTVTSSPVVVNDSELAVTDSTNEIVFLDRATGAVLWTDHPVFDSNLTSLASDGARVYVAATSEVIGGISAFSADPCGQPTCPALAGFLYGDTTNPQVGQLAVAGGLLYSIQGNRVFIYGTPCPALFNCFATTSITLDSPVTGVIVSGGRIYVTTTTGVTAFGL